MSATETAQWTFPATLAASSDACSAAEIWARAADLEDMVVFRLLLILEELFTNTVKYGYGARDDGVVRISLTCREGQLALVYADQAPPFDPTTAPEIEEPDIGSERVGGVGLRLIKVVGRNVTYRHADGWNELRLAIDGDRSD